LKSITEIYSGNKIKVEKNNQLSEEHRINHGVRQGCPIEAKFGPLDKRIKHD
jgi:hypothetical protein